MDEFKDGEKVLVSDLEIFSPEDWVMTEDEYQNLLYHNNMVATIDCMACDGYYDITFDDGYTVTAISDFHLSKY